ncbi:hypothetical protein OK074_2681 [Actinobacteria bacterium OK074]|nr:hypothetical protein OK074_2681 [Actinobacteria bacterium OK074]
MPAHSTSWGPTTLVRVDHEYDARNASDGSSRYGAYLAARLDEFHEYGEPEQPLSAGEFAATVWRVATSPVMSPGYVRVRPDLTSVTPRFSEDGEYLFFDLHVPLQHHDLEARHRIAYTWRDWQPGEGSSGPYRPSWEPDSKHPAVLTTTVVRIVADDTWRLVAPQHTRGRGLLDDAKRAVAVLVENINKHGGPLVAALRDER